MLRYDAVRVLCIQVEILKFFVTSVFYARFSYAGIWHHFMDIIQEIAILILWWKTCTLSISHRLKKEFIHIWSLKKFFPKPQGGGGDSGVLTYTTVVGRASICHSLKFHGTWWKCSLRSGKKNEKYKHPGQIPDHGYFRSSFVFTKMWLFLRSSWRLMLVCVRVSFSFNRNAGPTILGCRKIIKNMLAKKKKRMHSEKNMFTHYVCSEYISLQRIDPAFIKIEFKFERN